MARSEDRLVAAPDLFVQRQWQRNLLLATACAALAHETPEFTLCARSPETPSQLVNVSVHVGPDLIAFALMLHHDRRCSRSAYAPAMPSTRIPN